MDTADYPGLAGEIASMVHGYPYADPSELLGRIGDEVSADPAGPHGRAMLAALWASRWFVHWKINDRGLVTALAEAAERAEAALTAAGCAGGHEHPDPADASDPEGMAALIEMIGGSDDRETVEAAACPGHLAPLATDTASTLRSTLSKRFAAPETEHLDARYLTADGRTAFDPLIGDLERQRYSQVDPQAQNAAIWSARRLLAGAPEAERPRLAIAVCLLAKHCYWSSTAPGIVGLYREALATVDRAPRETSCPHGEGHRGVKLAAPPRPEAPDERGELCPRRVAEQVHDMLDYTRDYLGS
ncbi:hypothetical protein [Actinomadura madurae]|uniref:hypothetical protein n=1 Tax=Actinomadura madurae TaxID=1993 RepID=UPI000D984CDE|nr:hypothetical protein [Actinomadura madurae]SPT51905.1 Uncharacterised protein [Actinomadura madurae]